MAKDSDNESYFHQLRPGPVSVKSHSCLLLCFWDTKKKEKKFQGVTTYDRYSPHLIHSHDMRTITTAFLLAVQYKRLAVESRQKTVVEELLCSFLLLALESLSPICFLHKSGRDAAALIKRLHALISISFL